jgi:hypothetical protein
MSFLFPSRSSARAAQAAVLADICVRDCGLVKGEEWRKLRQAGRAETVGTLRHHPMVPEQ